MELRITYELSEEMEPFYGPSRSEPLALRMTRPTFRNWYYNRDRTGESQKRTAKLRAERGTSYEPDKPCNVE